MKATHTFASQYGPWALVAGGSEGLGEAFAHELAARGLKLILVARRKDVLDKAAARLAHGAWRGGADDRAGSCGSGRG